MCGPPVATTASGTAARTAHARRTALSALSVEQERPIRRGLFSARKRRTQADGQGGAFMSSRATRKPCRSRLAPIAAIPNGVAWNADAAWTLAGWGALTAIRTTSSTTTP
jgi:hypothetical protein